MGNMVYLPNGKIFVVNGGGKGKGFFPLPLRSFPWRDSMAGCGSVAVH